MNREHIEEAIKVLADKLNRVVDDENEYQKYFEDNPIVFQVLGYTSVIPTPHLPIAGSDHLSPDFLAKRVDGLFEIVELKTPYVKLIKERKYRDDLYSEVSSYIAQVQTYSEYFDDAESRRAVQQRYGVNVQKRPPVVLIVGRDEELDKHHLHTLTHRRGGPVRIVTFDDILSALYFAHASLYGDESQFRGGSFHSVLALMGKGDRRERYIVDFGASLERNRCSLFLDASDRLVFRVIDNRGDAYVLAIPSGADTFAFDSLHYFSWEFGNSSDQALLQLLVDARICARTEMRVPLIVPTASAPWALTIGADLTATNNGHFAMRNHMIFDRVLTFSERQHVAEQMLDELDLK